MFTYDEVFWLNVTNMVLGLATLICLLVIGYAVFKEIRGRVKANAEETSVADDHTFVIDGLGVTMADGGEKTNSDVMLVVTEDGIESVGKSEAPRQRNRRQGK